MADDNCIYKAVNMAAGEVFVLPPGAVLISVSDTGAVTSSCPGDLPQADIKCWSIKWVMNWDQEGDQLAAIQISPFVWIPGNMKIPVFQNAWDDEDGDGAIIISNISIGNQLSATSVGASDFASLEQAIAASPAGALMMDRKYKHFDKPSDLSNNEQLFWIDGYRSGYVIYAVYFKATEDMAKTVYLEFTGDETIGNIPRYFAAEMDCEDYPGDTEVPTCST